MPHASAPLAHGSGGAFVHDGRGFRRYALLTTGAAVAALIPANTRVIFSGRWYKAEAFARNEALLLLNLLAYGLLHAGRRCMEIATRNGWSLRRYRERVLSIDARITIHARRVILVVAQSAQRLWSLIWPAVNRMAWPPP